MLLNKYGLKFFKNDFVLKWQMVSLFLYIYIYKILELWVDISYVIIYDI